MAPAVRLRGKSSRRDPVRFPFDDELLGASLFGQVRVALERGMPGPASFVFFGAHVDRFTLTGLGKATAGERQRLLAAMAGQDSVECMAILGAFRFRGQGALNGQWVASVFIEWPDNRWWTAWQPISPTRDLIGIEPQIRSAVDGSPRPTGVGGWFARSRREGLKLRVQRDTAPVH